MRDKHGISPKQKALEFRMDNFADERIEQSINEAQQYGGDITMADKQHRPHKEKKKKKKPK